MLGWCTVDIILLSIVLWGECLDNAEDNAVDIIL